MSSADATIVDGKLPYLAICIMLGSLARAPARLAQNRGTSTMEVVA